MIFVYNLLWVLSVPGLILSAAFSRKRRKTVLQRLGRTGTFGLKGLKPSASDAGPIWVHALSVGEVLSAAAFARRIKQRHPDHPVVFSASTHTGFETASGLLRHDLDAVFYFPYDLIFSVRAAIDQIRPALVVIVETDIWPNFLFEMRRRRIPVLLVNARLSDRSYSGYKRFLRFISPVFACFSLVCTQSREDARRFMELGLAADKLAIAGNLKYDASADLVSENVIASLRKLLPAQPHVRYLVAGSTHPGEEVLLLEAFSRVREKISSLCLILAPRDIARADEIRTLAVSKQFSSELLTRLEPRSEELPDVVVVNTIGHLKALYFFSDVAFVGGSLVNFGGHNPLEPAAFAKPILLGPHTGDVTESSNRLLAAGGAQVVHDAPELVQATLTLLNNPELALAMGKNAFQVLQENQGALEKTLRAVGRFI